MEVIAAKSHKRALKLKAEAVVIGTGAGGSMMARELAEAGVKVIAIEMGGHHRPKDFNQLEDEMFEMLFQERGASATADLKIRLLSGIGIGGSTVHNTNLCKRTPTEVLKQWAKDYQVSGLSAEDLAPAFEKTEAELSVKALTESELNRNNALFRKGVEALGYKGGFLSHNREGCLRSGFCELGCAYNAKQNAAKVLIPKALSHGAQVYEGLRADRVELRGGRARVVRGKVLDTETLEPRLDFEIEAEVVCLAGNAIRSPAVLLQSGIGDAAGLTGKNFRCHPGAVIAGIFDEPVDSWTGIPQAYECMEMLDYEDREKNTWIIPGAAHPIGTAAMAPGFGPVHRRFMRQYRQMGALIVMLDEEASGQVSVKSNGRILVHHALNSHDKRQMLRGLECAAKILFAAGAKEVIVPHYQALSLTDLGQVNQIQERGLPDYDLALTGVHPMGTLRMGDDPGRAVVKSTGEHHRVKGLFVCDGSVFPTALGAPPQISIYSVSRHFSKFVIESLRG